MAPSKATTSVRPPVENLNPSLETPPPGAEVLRFPRPWLFELQLQPRALALALSIAQWTLPSSKGGYCYYSARKLAGLLGWSVATVERGLADLRAAGILETARRGRRIVAPVREHSRSIDGVEAENPLNGEGTLTKPRKRLNLRPKREGALQQRSSLEATEEPPSLEGREGKGEKNEGTKAKPTATARVETAKPKPTAESVLDELEATVAAEGISLRRIDRHTRLWAVKDALNADDYPRARDRGGDGCPDVRDLRRTVQVAIDNGWAIENGADVIRHALKSATNYARAVEAGVGICEQQAEADIREQEIEASAACEHQYEAHERACGCTTRQRTDAGQRAADRIRDGHERDGSIVDGVCTKPVTGVRCVLCQLETKIQPVEQRRTA